MSSPSHDPGRLRLNTDRQFSSGTRGNGFASLCKISSQPFRASFSQDSRPARSPSPPRPFYTRIPSRPSAVRTPARVTYPRVAGDRYDFPRRRPSQRIRKRRVFRINVVPPYDSVATLVARITEMRNILANSYRVFLPFFPPVYVSSAEKEETDGV